MLVTYSAVPLRSSREYERLLVFRDFPYYPTNSRGIISQEELEDVFKTNFHGPLNITKALLPDIRKKGKGTLLYMSSQAGWHTDPCASGYCATKFALEGTP